VKKQLYISLNFVFIYRGISVRSLISLSVPSHSMTKNNLQHLIVFYFVITIVVVVVVVVDQ
jgi:hypothetical protein